MRKHNRNTAVVNSGTLRNDVYTIHATRNKHRHIDRVALRTFVLPQTFNPTDTKIEFERSDVFGSRVEFIFLRLSSSTSSLGLRIPLST